MRPCFPFRSSRLGVLLGVGLLLLSSLALPAVDAQGAVGPTGVASAASGTHASAAPSGGALAGSLVSVPLTGGVPSTSSHGARLPGTTQVAITISLAGRDASGLRTDIAGQSTPGSPDYGATLTPAEYGSQYGPNPLQVALLETYLADHGLSYSRVGDMLSVHGTALQMEQTFSTTLFTFPSKSGTVEWAPLTAPQLPGTVAGVVSNIMGLNTLVRPETFQSFPPGIASAAPSGPAPPALPAGTITVTITTPAFVLSSGGTTYFDPPTNVSVGFTATGTLPSGETCAPCIFTWNFGDGTVVKQYVNGSATDTYAHAYTQAVNLNQAGFPTISVNVTDTQGSAGQVADTVLPTISPQWMQQAYGEDPLFAKGFSGQGSIIGLDELCDSSYDTGTSQYNASVDAFSSTFGLPIPNVIYIGAGVNCPSGDGSAGWSLETILDMDWAHAMAPSATLEVYFGQSSSGSDIALGDAQWASGTSGVFEASNSWGIPELAAISGPGVAGPFDTTWSQAAATGVTLFAASGDCGGTDNVSGYASYGPNVSYPADNPQGVGVGGSIVQTSHTGSWLNDWVWNGSASTTACQNNQGTGGGWSKDYTTPGYQSGMSGAGTVPPAKWPIKKPRGIPDVAMNAATYVDIDYVGGDTSLGYPAGWYPTGGTSLASPMWAATVSVALQALNRHYNTTAPGFLNPAFYKIGENSGLYPTSFHDVTGGMNTDPFGYPAATGWDPTTGWGTPNAAGLVKGLAQALPMRYPVWGVVADSGTGAGIGGAVVTASNNGGSAVTLSNGSFNLDLVNGTFTLTAQHSGYNPNTRGVRVYGAPLHGQNILLYFINVTGKAWAVTGALKAQTGVPLPGGTVNVTAGPMQGSAATGQGGLFTLYLLNGTYSLTGSIHTLFPWINPAFNDSTITITVSGPMSNVVIYLYYDLHGIVGQVLSATTGKPIPNAQVLGLDILTASTVANAQGQFALHLPTGPAALTGSASNYLNATVSQFVNENDTATVTIYLDPAVIFVNQFAVQIRAVAPVNLSNGLPVVTGSASIPIDLWANNSTTGLPQVGIRVALTNTLGGWFSTSDAVIPAAGMALITYHAPYTTVNRIGLLNAAVSTPGWTGGNSTKVQVLSQTSACGSSCWYPIQGSVLSTTGAPVAGATVTLMDSTGSTTKNSTTTSAKGTFLIYAHVGSYTIAASAANFQTAKAIPLSVSGAVSRMLILVPNAQPVGTGVGFVSVELYVITALLGVILAMTLLLLYRRLKEKPPVEPTEPGSAEKAPIDASAEIFPAMPESPSLPPPGNALPPGPPPAAGPVLPPPASSVPGTTGDSNPAKPK